MEMFDDVILLFNSSNTTSNVTSTLPFVVEAFSVGGSLVFSFIGVYLNLVLARSLFKSTLLATSHRRTIRFFSYVHVILGVIICFTSICWLFRFLTWPILPVPALLYITLREIARASLPWCCMERIVFNQNASVREDKVGKLSFFLRLGSFLIAIATTSILGILIRSCSLEALVPNDYFLFSLGIFSVLPFPMIIIILILISHTAKKHRLSHGLVAAVRTKKLELERAALRNCVFPLTFMISICSVVELLIFFFTNYLFTPLSFLIYSCRVIIFPVAHITMQPLLREDCRLNIFIWRKLQRRSSEARVRTIMNKESQESIISNFRMIGILSE